MIVIDEFATLAKELPEFVEGVVDVAQRGRSLGVHLVLATQRPGGVVSDNIRANVEPADRAADGARRPSPRTSSASPTRRRIAALDPGPRVRARRPGGADGVPGRLRRRDHDGRGRPGRRSSCASSASARPRRGGPAEPSVDRVRHGPHRPRGARQGRQRRPTSASSIPPQPSPWLPALEPDRPARRRSPPERATRSRPFGADRRARAASASVPLTHDFEQRRHRCSSTARAARARRRCCGRSRSSLAAQTPPGPAAPVRARLRDARAARRSRRCRTAAASCSARTRSASTRLLHTLAQDARRRAASASPRAARSRSREYNRRGPRSTRRCRGSSILFDGYAGFFAAFERINLGELVDLLPRLVADSRPLGVHFVITAERRAAISGAAQRDRAREGRAAHGRRGRVRLARAGHARSSRTSSCPPAAASCRRDWRRRSRWSATTRRARASSRRSAARRARCASASATATSRRSRRCRRPCRATTCRRAAPLRPILGLGDDDLDSARRGPHRGATS